MSWCRDPLVWSEEEATILRRMQAAPGWALIAAVMAAEREEPGRWGRRARAGAARRAAARAQREGVAGCSSGSP